MDEATPELFSRLSAIGTTETHVNSDGTVSQVLSDLNTARHNELRGAYAGKVAFILTCGPSLEEVWSNELKDALSDKLVIAVKQAQQLAPEIVDLHLYNEVRMQDYSYAKSPTVRLSVSQFMPDHPSHIHYPISEYKYERSLFVTDEYEKWDLTNGVERPWGVGIMFELGLHLPLYLGCRAAVIIGFDMNNRGKYHFYDQTQQADSKHYKVDPEEFGYARRSTTFYTEWAHSKGLEVVLYSPLSDLNIPQISPDLLPAYLW